MGVCRCPVCGYVNVHSLTGLCEVCEWRSDDFDDSRLLWERR